MEEVAGDPLEKFWSTLSFEAKRRIMKSLGSIAKELRSLPAPKLYDSITEGNLPHPPFWFQGNVLL
jgi:hypothetical protein